MFYVWKISVPNALTRFVDKNATNVKGLSASFGWQSKSLSFIITEMEASEKKRDDGAKLWRMFKVDS